MCKGIGSNNCNKEFIKMKLLEDQSKRKRDKTSELPPSLSAINNFFLTTVASFIISLPSISRACLSSWLPEDYHRRSSDFCMEFHRTPVFPINLLYTGTQPLTLV
ncbi:hypothetical protein CEXT_231951 [Caerostris extrusa]|uniref:Uncharacterized protein n=1 Tax=Caerostris extrusa TaxID=172846 RepID=A0AAV4SSE7_CAEEX|nr:hypothetical protein CEXT_231951 [Caerostris extrusa]